MQWLMKTLVKASRLEQGILVFDIFPASLVETLARSISSVYALAREKQISIETQGLKECVCCHNPKWTAEAIGNLLENAVKYSPAGSKISIETEVMELYANVKITDEGPGIPKEEYNRIFRRFYRGEQAEQQEGSGLGLYLAQVILQREKGYITVSKGRDGGACFSVFLLLKEYKNHVKRSSDNFVRTFFAAVRGMSDFFCKLSVKREERKLTYGNIKNRKSEKILWKRCKSGKGPGRRKFNCRRRRICGSCRYLRQR